MEQFRLDLVFHHTRPARLHRAHVGFGRNSCGIAQLADFVPAFIQAHVMQDVVQGDELLRRVHPGTNLAAHPVDPAEHALVERDVVSHGVINPFPVLQQSGQDVVHIGNGIGVICAVIITGALQARTGTVPDFLFRITLTAEQDKFALAAARDQRQDGFRFRERGQVKKIAVGTIAKRHIPVAYFLGRGGQDGNAVISQHIHEFLAALAVFGVFHVAEHEFQVCLTVP